MTKRLNLKPPTMMDIPMPPKGSGRPMDTGSDFSPLEALGLPLVFEWSEQENFELFAARIMTKASIYGTRNDKKLTTRRITLPDGTRAIGVWRIK